MRLGRRDFLAAAQGLRKDRADGWIDADGYRNASACGPGSGRP
jgi:hypothetical protein